MTDAVRIPESALEAFHTQVFEALDVPAETARLAARSLLDASLMGVDTHGVEALDMYVNHLRAGGLDPLPEPLVVTGHGSLDVWDMQNGFGLAGGRRIMAHAIARAREHGTYFATCRNATHIGACGVYGKMATDAGLIGMVGQQARSAFPPWGGREKRVGPSPIAFVAPVAGGFPFYYDASFATISNAQIKAHMRQGTRLPEGVAADKDGNPTTDPELAWVGHTMPIGKYKGVGLAMVGEILHAVLSGNVMSNDMPSIVSHPEKAARSSLFMLAIAPGVLAAEDEFEQRMKDYVDYVESSPACDTANPPRYPGRREGENWTDRRANGIPVSPDALVRFDETARSLKLSCLSR